MLSAMMTVASVWSLSSDARDYLPMLLCLAFAAGSAFLFLKNRPRGKRDA